MKYSMWLKLAVGAMAMLVGLSGCGEATGDFDNSDDGGSSDWRFEEPATASSAICLPQPTVRMGDTAPELPETYRELCASEPDKIHSMGTDITLRCEEDRFIRDVVTTVDGFQEGVTQWTVEDDQVVHIDEELELGYAAAMTHRTWDFDDLGRLVSSRTSRVEDSGTETVQSSLTQTFEEDRLVRRVREYPGSRHEKSWEYDAQGRLIEAKGSPDAQYLVTYEYDRGLPLKIERRVEGELIHEQNFEWTAGGALERRSSQVDLGKHHLLDREIDTYGTNLTGMGSGYTYGGDHRRPFGHSVFHADRESDCQLPPLTMMHGYPRTEGGYELGWTGKAADVYQDTYHLSAAYGGYSGYYAYVPNDWFGHDAAGFSWPVRSHLPGILASEQVYDSEGRMMTEEAVFDVEETEESDAMSLQWSRERVFDDHGVTGDFVEFQTLQVDEDIRRKIHWDRDEAGRMVGRHLTEDNEVLARQKWRFDGEFGVALEIFSQPAELDYGNGELILNPGHELEKTGHFERLFDDEGKLLESTIFVDQQYNQIDSGRRFHYDEEGELIETEYF